MKGNLTEIQTSAAAAQSAEKSAITIVIPYTTPDGTRVALKRAAEMSSGLNATIRLIDAVVVPIQRPIGEPQINGEFLEHRLRGIAEESRMPVHVDIVFTRDRLLCFEKTLMTHSVVVIAVGSMRWPSFERKLARYLTKAGHDVVLVARDGSRC